MFLRIYTYLAFTCVDCRVAYKDKSTETTMTHKNNNYSKTIYLQPQMKKKQPFVIVLKSMTSFFNCAELPMGVLHGMIKVYEIVIDTVVLKICNCI